MLYALGTAALAFYAPAMTVSSSSISMKAAPAPVVSEWADPVAAHGSALSMKEIPFDPLGLASEENLVSYREAEIKHGRVAMLAALGWPAAEKFEPLFAKLTGSFDELAETGGRAPSLLNGGLEESQIPFFLLGAFSVAGYADFKGTEIQKQLKLEPGNVGFDPLSLFPEDAPTQEKYRLAELKHGRIAMLAITFYALEEAISGTSILKETVPLAQEIERLIAEGPIQGNIDAFKDLSFDVKALLADSAKEEQFYGDAFTTKLFSRPDVHTVGAGDALLPLALLFGGAASANK
jgi:hypothetical protein